MSSLKLKHSGGNSMSIEAPATNPASNLALKLPATIGSANQFVKNSGTAGTLGWSSVIEDSSGRLLLGTTTEGHSTADDLTVATSGHTGITLRSGSSNNGNIYFSDGTSGNAELAGYIQYSHTSNHLLFGTNESTRILIDSSGNVGIGNTSPSTGANGISFLPFVANDTSRIIFARNGSGYLQTVLEFQNGGSTVGTIKHNDSSTQYNTSSDYRLKENVVGISDGITRLKTLKPSRFNFKINKDKTVDGFLAHEVTAVPEAINGTKDEVDSDNNPVYQGIDQSKLVPLLTAALQEAITKIETLETKVAALEAG
jgi:hypothetical protein